MNHPAPKFDGSVRMTHAQIQAEIRHRIISAVQSGQMTQAQAAERFGMTRQRVSQMICDARNGVERGPKCSDRVTPSGKPIYEPKETGGCRWTKEATAELKEWVCSGEGVYSIARAFGLNVATIRKRAVAHGWIVQRKTELEAKVARIIESAPSATSFAELASRFGVSVSFVSKKMEELAPFEYARLRTVAPARSGLSAAEPVCWHKRAQDLFPHDPALVRSLARLASFVATTKDGVTVRLLPPRCTVA